MVLDFEALINNKKSGRDWGDFPAALHILHVEVRIYVLHVNYQKIKFQPPVYGQLL